MIRRRVYAALFFWGWLAAWRPLRRPLAWFLALAALAVGLGAWYGLTQGR